MLTGRVGDLVEWIERAGVHLSRLRADDRRSFASTQRFAQGSGAHPSLVVRRDDVGRAEPEQAQSAIDSHVPLSADEHANARTAREPFARDIPARLFEHAEARSG
jgi:hypothetical protein